jgi:hypothetical protein
VLLYKQRKVKIEQLKQLEENDKKEFEKNFGNDSEGA